MSSSLNEAAPGDRKRWRLFVAAPLSEANRAALKRPISELASLNPAVNPSRIDAIHLTLNFLNSVETNRIEGISRSLKEAVALSAGFEVDVVGVGAFPSLARPRVLWAGISGAGRARLIELQAATGAALRAAGMEVESRSYTPHLTLARLRAAVGAAERSEIARWSERWTEAGFGALAIDALHLMRSELSERPTRHTSLQSFALQ